MSHIALGSALSVDPGAVFLQKKNAAPWGRRSNYAHLTGINIPSEHHRFVKSDLGLWGKKSSPEKLLLGADNYALFT